MGICCLKKQKTNPEQRYANFEDDFKEMQIRKEH